MATKTIVTRTCDLCGCSESVSNTPTGFSRWHLITKEFVNATMIDACSRCTDRLRALDHLAVLRAAIGVQKEGGGE